MRKALAGLFVLFCAGPALAGPGNLFVTGPRLKIATVGGSVSTYPLVLQFPVGSVVNNGSTATVTFILDAQDEGNFIGSFSTINCVGLGIDCTKSGNVLTITVNGGGGGGGGGGLTIYRNGTSGFSASTINIITSGFITSVVGSSITWGLDPNTSFYILNSSKPQSGYYTFFVPSATVQDLYFNTATVTGNGGSLIKISSGIGLGVAAGPQYPLDVRRGFIDSWGAGPVANFDGGNQSVVKQNISPSSSYLGKYLFTINNANAAEIGFRSDGPGDPVRFYWGRYFGGTLYESIDLLQNGFVGIGWDNKAPKYMLDVSSGGIIRDSFTVNGLLLSVSSFNAMGPIVSTGQFVLNGGTLTSAVVWPDGTIQKTAPTAGSGCDYCNLPKTGATNYIQNNGITLQPASFYVLLASASDMQVDRATFTDTLNMSKKDNNAPTLWFGTNRGNGFSGNSGDSNITFWNSFTNVAQLNLSGLAALKFYAGNGSEASPSLTFNSFNGYGGYAGSNRYFGISADSKEEMRFISGGGVTVNENEYDFFTPPPSMVVFGTNTLLTNHSIVLISSNTKKFEVDGTSTTVYSTFTVTGTTMLQGSSIINGATVTAGIRLPDGSLLVGASGGSVNGQVYLDTGNFRREYEVFHTTVDPIIANLLASSNSVSADISNLTYYLHTETTGTASAYQLLLSSPMIGAEVIKTKNVTNALGLVKISSHVTRDIDPQIRLINAGVWTFPTWASVDTLGGLTQIVVTISTCSYDLTTITEVLSATSPAFVITGVERFDLVAVQQSDIVLSTSDRILAQYFARSTLALGGNVSLYLGGTARPTHIETPISSLYKFTQLADTPKTLVNQRGKFLSVNDDETATVFVATPTNRLNALQTDTTTVSNKIPVINIYDEGTVVGNATTINCVGSAVTCTNSGSTTTLTVTAASAGDNFGSHKATQVVNMAGFGISEASGIIVLNQISIGTRTPSSTIMLQISTSAEAQNTVIFVQIGTNTTPIYEMTPTSFTCRAATVTFTGTLVVSSKTVTANSGAIISSLTYKNTGDGIARTQKNAGLELALSTVPTGNISTMTVIIATVAFNYVVIDASPTVGTNGGDIFIRFNNDASAIYTIGRTTSSGQNISTIKVGSSSAVGLSIFGNEIATTTSRTVELMFFRNYAQFPKKGLFNAVSIDSANIIPSESRGSFGWLGSAAINRIDVFFSHKGKPASDGATFALGSGIHVYNRDD